MRYSFLLLTLCVSCVSRDQTAPVKPSVSNPSVEPVPAKAAASAQPDKTDHKPNQLAPQEQQAWRKRSPLPANCAEYDPEDPDSFGARILPLNDKQTIVEARCMLGTYQQSHLVFLWDATTGQARRLSFPVYQRKAATNTPIRTEEDELWGDTEFDASSKQLKVFNRFRQTGDCGYWALYSFPEGAVKLDEFHLKPVCDGKDAMGPQHWPAVTP